MSPREDMPTSDGRSRRRSESKLADDPRRRGNRHQQLRGPLCRRPVFRRLAACCWFSFCVLGATNVAAKTQGADGATVGRGQRAGSIAGLVEGRISLANVTKMLTSSVHMEVSPVFLFCCKCCKQLLVILLIPTCVCHCLQAL